ncbi:DUF4232 domain-containing protein [Mycolicibacterium sp. Dal123E01]|uniref:DUF4232 domain-containing protein n=1 Tax=Mycolicibacterium sp. Dal123E01 TaxID=3457578 RepID=UPI00403EB936
MAVVMPLLQSPTATAEPWCATDFIGLSTSAPASPGDQSQIHFNIILTNTSPQACMLQGYPGVDLIGPDNPMWGPDYQLPQQAGDPQPIILAPGTVAISRLTFLADPHGWVPATIAVTLPSSPGRLETPWLVGGVPLARQDGATHPGTYIGPLQLVDPAE